MLTPILLTSLLSLAGPDAETVRLSASLSSEALTVGSAYEIELSLELAEGWSASESGIPKVFLQIAVPGSVQLEGKVLTEYRELSRNEFLQQPFERLIEPGTSMIRFTLKDTPQPGEAFALNVVAYISSEQGDGHYFIRRRLKLALKAGAQSKEINPRDTSWGEHESLKVGDQADDFTLPQFGGGSISLSAYRGKKNVIITTYRAHW